MVLLAVPAALLLWRPRAIRPLAVYVGVGLVAFAPWLVRNAVWTGGNPVFPEAMRTLEEFAAMRAAVDVPILANMTEFGKSELFSVEQLRSVGVNIVIWPVSLLRIAMGGASRALDTIVDEGHLTSKLGEMQHRADLYDLIDYEQYNHFDQDVFNFQIQR